MPVLDDTRWCTAPDCSRLIGDPRSHLCGACTTVTETALREIPDLAGELEVTLYRQDQRQRFGAPRVEHTPEPALPFNERAHEVAADTWTTLRMWLQVVCEHDGGTPPPGRPTLAVLAEELLSRVDLLARNPDAGMAASDLVATRDLLRRVVDIPPELDYAGPCDQCTADLYGRLDRSTVTCRECAAVYPTAGRRKWLLEALREHRATASEIAHGIGTLLGQQVSRARIGMWITRGKLSAQVPTHAEVAAKRTPIYRVGDAIDVATETAKRKSKSA